MRFSVIHSVWGHPLRKPGCFLVATLASIAGLAWAIAERTERLEATSEDALIRWSAALIQALAVATAAGIVGLVRTWREELSREVQEFADAATAVAHGHKKRCIRRAVSAPYRGLASAINRLIDAHVQTEHEWETKKQSLGLREQARTVALWRAQRSLQDESERRRKAEQDLNQAQKMEALGKFAGSIAHDFNNLLTVILGGVECAHRHLPPDHPAATIIKTIEQAAERGAQLTRPLLAFSRNHLHVTEPIQLNDAILEAANLAQRLIGQNIELRTELDPGLRLVEGNANQIQQILMNLIVNARDAMNGAGILTISTANVAVEEDRAQTHGTSSEDGWVALFVSDTGCGMDEQTKRKIFEPFFTTKPVGKGTGLGLATVFGIVRQSRGFLEVESAPGEGATFQVFLPATRKAKAAEVATGKSIHLPSREDGHETILLVDDEDDIREFGRMILESFGYTVFTAASAAEAIVVAEQHGPTLALVITDVTMPGMNGVQLAEVLLQRFEHLKVLFVSGHSDEVILADSLRVSAVSFLQKPYRSEALARQVRATIDGTGEANSELAA